MDPQFIVGWENSRWLCLMVGYPQSIIQTIPYGIPEVEAQTPECRS
jgi:hypothetical protein